MKTERRIELRLAAYKIAGAILDDGVRSGAIVDLVCEEPTLLPGGVDTDEEHQLLEKTITDLAAALRRGRLPY